MLYDVIVTYVQGKKPQEFQGNSLKNPKLHLKKTAVDQWKGRNENSITFLQPLRFEIKYKMATFKYFAT